MQTGMINTDNLAQILRGISQKRQNGSLEIVFPEYQLSILFAAGKIVEACQLTHNPALEVLQVLKSAGFVQASVDELTIENYRDAFLWLNERDIQEPLVDEHIFRRALKHRILNILYDLHFENPAIFNVKLHMPQYDRDFSPSISVGQLLLDRVSLEAEAPRFNKLFAPHAWIVRQELGGLSLSEEEKTLYDLIGEGIRKEDLDRRSLLSRYHLQTCLLSLHERAIIEAEGAQHGDDFASVLDENIVTALEVSTERPFIERELHPEQQTRRENTLSPIAANVDSTIAGPEIKTEMKTRLAQRSNRSLPVLNAKLLQSNAVPNLLALLFAASALLAPLLFWRTLWLKF